MPNLPQLERLLIVKLERLPYDDPDRERVRTRLAEVQAELARRDHTGGDV